ncbi:SipW-dependent-type signal peptide-containing protein [uncultured Microbacterium sp.]|uniref:SipW-dependent-type signal peptide-containing protein n=1 Tax=uncultured Microbacterium sp. TaxID=191216 RepID=UPI00260CB152|nr:SipW-dependent-type signal peptide-containing protein [uncultured Microbacterium sp.]
MKASRRNKIYAVLAGGLVLGVGAAVTLAAWNDSEFATGNFTAGSFIFEGSENGTAWGEHDAEGAAAALTFTANFDNLSPDDVVYAPYALRLTSTTDADLTSVAPVVTGDLDGQLTFDAVATTAFGCDDATDFAGGSAVPTTIADGEVINLCLAVTASSTLVQGDTGTAVWQWTAESQ